MTENTCTIVIDSRFSEPPGLGSERRKHFTGTAVYGEAGNLQPGGPRLLGPDRTPRGRAGRVIGARPQR